MRVTDKDYEKAREYFGISASRLRAQLSEYIDVMEKREASWTWFLEKVLAVMYRIKEEEKNDVNLGTRLSAYILFLAFWLGLIPYVLSSIFGLRYYDSFVLSLLLYIFLRVSSTVQIAEGGEKNEGSNHNHNKNI